MKNLTKNWKTTLAGVITIAGVIIATWFPEHQETLAKVVGVLAGLGFLVAKDGDKTGV